MTESVSNSLVFTNQGSMGVRDIEEGNNNGQAQLEMMSTRGNNDRYIGHMDEWAGSLERILQDLPHSMCIPGHPGKISRIPESLRDIDLKSYEPQFLSVGPYHHGKPRVEQMEKRKLVVLKCFLQQKLDLTLKDYLKEMKNIEQQARKFYSDVEMESEKFVQMLLLDSVFILPLFCGMPGRQETRTSDENEKGIAKEAVNSDESTENNGDQVRWFWTSFAHDLFLLENQLPFFVLQKMYDLAYCGSKAQLSCIMKYEIGNMLSNYARLDSETVLTPTEEVHHLLHLCHMFFRPKIQQDPVTCHLLDSSQMFRLGSAVQLYEAGVNFEVKSASTHHALLDITFDGSGNMSMPCLPFDDNTSSLLRNLIALEQMKYPSLGVHVSAYAVLLLHLVTTPDDVKLLRRKGVIQHHLSSDKEMMYLINRLSVGLSFDYVDDKYSLKPVFCELKRYSERRSPRWTAWLRHRYFNNPWMVISLLTASLLLILSVVETYYGVASYYHPWRT